MNKDRRSNVEGDILDEVLKNNGTRTNRNGALKGLQQYQTPPALANKLVEKLNIHPGQSVYDPQCAHGNLLHATLYHCHKFGVELDPTAVAYHRTSSTIVEGSTPKFEEVMDELIDPDWLVDFAVANPPFGLSWGGEDSTLWTFIHCVRHSNAGLLIGNASTIERLEIATEVSNEVGILVHRIAGLHECSFTILVNASEPGGDRDFDHGKDLSSLRRRPAACGLELENGHSFGRPVVRSPMGRDLRHAKLVDAEFLVREGDLLMGAVQIRLQSDAGIRAVGRPAPGVSQRELA